MSVASIRRGEWQRPIDLALMRSVWTDSTFGESVGRAIAVVATVTLAFNIGPVSVLGFVQAKFD